jgi:hypothetical protein
VFIGESATPWLQVKVASPNRIMLKGGEALEQLFSTGVAVPIRIENPDGQTVTIDIVR